MRIANQWNDYRILDTSGQEKLEQWGNVTLIRPDPQIIWKTPKEHGMQTGIITARMLVAAAGIFSGSCRKRGTFNMHRWI